MRILIWVLRIVPLLLVLAFLDFYLPSNDVVRIVDTDVKRMNVVSRDFVEEDAVNLSTLTRDVRFINAVWPDGVPRVYRNEETGWGFPFYFKFDSGNLQTEAQDLRSTGEAPNWVVVTHYGWRIEIFSMFPNAVTVKQVASQDHFPIPVFRIVFFFWLGVVLLGIWWAWRRLMSRSASSSTGVCSRSMVPVKRWYCSTQASSSRLNTYVAPESRRLVSA